jgi:MoxR-like ATPase
MSDSGEDEHRVVTRPIIERSDGVVRDSMDVGTVSDRHTDILDEVSRAVIADEDVLRTVLTGFLSRGHVLLEDVPRTGKTLTADSLATALLSAML